MKPRAFVLVETDIGTTFAVTEHLRKIDGVVVDSTSAVSGPYDVVALVEGDTHNAIGRLVEGKIQKIAGVRRTLTCFWISSKA